MADIQFPTTENRRGKTRKKDSKKIEATATKYNVLPITMSGHNNNRAEKDENKE